MALHIGSQKAQEGAWSLGDGWKLEAINTSYGAQRPLAWIDDVVSRLEAWANVNPGI